MSTKNRRNFALSILATMVLSTALPLNAGEIYRWVDKNGVTNYSETKPPQQQKSQSISIKQSEASQPSKTVAPSNKTLDQSEADFRQRQIQRAEQEQREKKAQQDSKLAAARCGNARGDLADLEKADRVYSYDENGKRVYSNSKERAAIIEEARARVNSLCR